MTIEKGKPWGDPVERVVELVIARSDAELSALVERDPSGDYAVVGGDLNRTLGSPQLGGDGLHRLPIDILHVDTGESRHIAIAHVVIRRRWWRGRVVVASNVDHLGEWNIAPGAHPNDGRFDVLDVDPAMRLRERLEARRRLPLGLHVPHPRISMRRVDEWEWTDRAGAGVWVDGVPIGERTQVVIRIEPDAAAVHI